MEIADKTLNKVRGAEAIVIHNGNVVLGMQKPQRWYELENGKRAAIIKTLGGQKEENDEESSKKTILREISEELKGIDFTKMKITKHPIFSKEVRMGEMNPFERDSNLSMHADFYLLNITDDRKIQPDDLPALVEIPLDDFLELDFDRVDRLDHLQKYVIENKENTQTLPQYYAFMVPKEVKDFLKTLFKRKEEEERE